MGFQAPLEPPSSSFELGLKAGLEHLSFKPSLAGLDSPKVTDDLRFFNILLSGYTEVGGKTSDILQKVQLDIIANQQCSSLYNDEENYHIYPSQICAGLMHCLISKL